MAIWLNGVKQGNIIVAKRFSKGNVVVVMDIVAPPMEKTVMLVWNWILQDLGFKRGT